MNILKPCVVIGMVLCVAPQARAQQAHVNLDWNPHKNVQNLNPFGANRHLAGGRVTTAR